MEEKDFEKGINNALDFYYISNVLKIKKRMEWINWKVNSPKLESYAEHVYGCQMLFIALNSEFDFDVDFYKVLAMLALHTLDKVIVSEYTQFDKITQTQKETLKKHAIEYACGKLSKKEEYEALIFEFSERKTKEAKVAYLVDKLEKCLQAKKYEDMRCNRTYDSENVPIWADEKMQNIINDGYSTVFEILSEYSKDIFKDEKVFEKVLEYTKDFDSNII